MDGKNEIRLRLRFYKNVPENVDNLFLKFKKQAQKASSEYAIKLERSHIWLDIKGPKKAYYSPHLHLKMEPKGESETQINGLFGPDPTLWTFFIFLHIVIAGIFVVFTGMAYSNYMSNNDITYDLMLMGLMAFSWILLYLIAKQIRLSGIDQMDELETLFLKIIKS